MIDVWLNVLLVDTVALSDAVLWPPYPEDSLVIGRLYKLCLCFAQQQDVSEFTHKLLDWLEDAFQMKAEEDR